ncbi:MAG TPA: ABC transporter permease [Ktedonobacteraceae bacterium]
MNISRIMALAGRILRQVVRDKRTLALIFVVPLVIMTLLALVLNSTSSILTLAIVRPTGSDSSRVNTLLNTLLPASDKLKTIDISAEQVTSTLNNGDADAALIFPANFAQDIASGKHPSVRIVLEGSSPATASALSEQLQALTGQLGVALAVTQSGQGLPATLNSRAPFSTAAPQYLHGGSQYTLTDSLAPVFIGVFSFFFVFLLTSVAFLRERSQGTIERVMVSPLTRNELVLGYVCGFTLFALLQALVILLFVVFVLQIHYSGNLALVFLISALLTLGSVNMGIFLSTFAQNEFQIMQFIPLVFGLQIFLSGIFWPLAQLPGVLHPFVYILPLTYANEALRAVMLKNADLAAIGPDLAALLLFALVMIGLSSLTTRRHLA